MRQGKLETLNQKTQIKKTKCGEFLNTSFSLGCSICEG